VNAVVRLLEPTMRAHTPPLPPAARLSLEAAARALALIAHLAALALAGGVALPGTVAAQEEPLVVIEGRLVDDATGEPVSGASVSLLPPVDDVVVTRRLTDAEGRFTFLADFGEWRLRAVRIGYATTTSDRFEIRRAGVTEVEFRIDMEAITLLPLVVEVGRPRGRDLFEERRRSPAGLFWSPEMVDSLRPTKHVAQLFENERTIRVRWDWARMQDMRVGPVPVVGTYFGRRLLNCLHWIVDYTLVAPPDFPFISFSTEAWATPPLSDVGPEDLVAVEFYRHGTEVPDNIIDQLDIRGAWERRELQKFNRSTCGVVVLWTEEGW
jgi:hypothetical protein